MAKHIQALVCRSNDWPKRDTLFRISISSETGGEELDALLKKEKLVLMVIGTSLELDKFERDMANVSRVLTT